MCADKIVSRFAPSPTGRIHAGNIFSYLINWLETKRRGGKILLRIEDLDQSRARDEYVDYILHDLEMLGLTWDGEVLFQSKRNMVYEHAFQKLKNTAELYPCFCTRASIYAASAPHANEQLVYPGTCYGLSIAERVAKQEELSQQHRHSSIRIHMPQSTIAFKDMYQGASSFDLAYDCGDCVIQRSDGGYSYNLAVVVDDAASGVNLIVRGCDLLPVTPMHIYLQQLLNYSRPQYAHVPLLISKEGRRIAKRDNDASLDEMLVKYKRPEAILGHIAFVAGLIQYDEPCTTHDLIDSANLETLHDKRFIVWS